MASLTNYPFPSYECNVPAAAVVSSLIGISLIGWIVQSVQARFKPRRPMILILIAHLTIFIELVLRAALTTETRNTRAAFTAMSVLVTVGQRTIILANYDYLTQVLEDKSKTSRAIIIGSMLGAITSSILMAPAGTASYDPETIERSFRLRQASTAIILIMTIVFYPVWFFTKTWKLMTKLAIILLFISSICTLIVAFYVLITSVPANYLSVSRNEYWYYIFQFTPAAIALFTWTILHPKRSLSGTATATTTTTA
mgnify:FL=1